MPPFRSKLSRLSMKMIDWLLLRKPTGAFVYFGFVVSFASRCVLKREIRLMNKISLAIKHFQDHFSSCPNFIS